MIAQANENELTYKIERTQSGKKEQEKVHYSHLRKWVSVPSYLLRNQTFRHYFFEDVETGKEIENSIIEEVSSISRDQGLNSGERSSNNSTNMLEGVEIVEDEEEDDFLGFSDGNPLPVGVYNRLPNLLDQLVELNQLPAEINKGSSNIDDNDISNISGGEFSILGLATSTATPTRSTNILMHDSIVYTQSPLGQHLLNTRHNGGIRTSSHSSRKDMSSSGSTEKNRSLDFHNSFDLDSNSSLKFHPVSYAGMSFIDNLFGSSATSNNNSNNSHTKNRLNVTNDSENSKSFSGFPKKISPNPKLLEMNKLNYSITEVELKNYSDLSSDDSIMGEFIEDDIDFYDDEVDNSYNNGAEIDREINRPFTRSRGAVPTYPNVLKTALEYQLKKGK
ncbi:UNVERIFIED_CONTAM: hypothetical protein RMT77_006993 [Armadillidium vulgare]